MTNSPCYFHNNERTTMIWPTMFILRGLPGSGKSHLAQIISSAWKADISIVSADQYFTYAGQYIYNRRKLTQAHYHCLEKCKIFLSRKTRRTIVVDNTHSQRWEYVPYLQLAQLHEVAVYILEIPCADKAQARFYHSRNVHNVPLKTIYNMRRRWEPDPYAVMIKDNNDLYHILATQNPE